MPAGAAPGGLGDVPFPWGDREPDDEMKALAAAFRKRMVADTATPI